ncbi:MAG: ABC transporter substrate-binding protein, partial [Firmicutes bacterium]|nr:ABC transporter substrate-binding protein [Bacillota bacterium]
MFGGCSPAEQEDPALQQDPEETGQSEQIGETERVFTDAVGREVTIPAEVNKVYSTSPIGTMLVYTINPDKLAGWNAELRAGELRFIAEEYHRLPVIGGWFGKTAEGNVEEIMKENPDVIISVGDIDSSSAETADQIQEQT